MFREITHQDAGNNMGNFFLIDQSLKGVGGHHFDYTHLISRAANNANWDVIVGCHGKFKSKEVFSSCEVRNCFRYTTYASCSNLIGIQEMVARRKRNKIWNVLAPFTGRGSSEEQQNKNEQEKRIQAFRQDCHSFFSSPLHKDDVVFFTTLSDLEAEGLFHFFRDRPDAKLAHWHLQFHFPIFRGRTPDYPESNEGHSFLQNTVGKLKALSPDQIHFYVTSENLKDQYDRLGIDFENLAYPVSPNLKVNHFTGSNPSLNARLTFAGAIRHEKGGSQIEQLIDELETEFGNSVRFCIQKKKKNLLAKFKSLFRKSKPTQDNLEVHQYPLSAEAYQSYIKKSDIGLLTTYDSETYFSRRAGILGEYLTAGVPVIVPAGSWLSDQIEIPQQEYLQRLIQDREEQQFSFRPQSVSNHSTGRTNASFDLGNTLTKTEGSHRMLVVGFDVVDPAEHGNYVRVGLNQNGYQSHSIVGINRRQRRLYVPFYPRPDTSKLTLELSPAFGSVPWQTAEIDLTLIASVHEIPRSVVGLVTSDWTQTSELTAEMIRQYDHYKKSSVRHAEDWFARHDPQRTVDSLVRNSFSSSPFQEEAA